MLSKNKNELWNEFCLYNDKIANFLLKNVSIVFDQLIPKYNYQKILHTFRKQPLFHSFGRPRRQRKYPEEKKK